MASYQGGCPYPYISEVGREGFNKFLFEFSTIAALFPWITYCMYYLDTNIQYGKIVIKGKSHYLFFTLMHTTLCMLLCSSAISFVVASMYDILHFPLIHEKVGMKRGCYYWLLVHYKGLCVWKHCIRSRCTAFGHLFKVNVDKDEEAQDISGCSFLDVLSPLRNALFPSGVRSPDPSHGFVFSVDEWRRVFQQYWCRESKQ